LPFSSNEETNMKLHTLALISTLALSAAAVHSVRADTLYSQVPTTDNAFFSGTGVNFVGYDNFTLGANGTMTSVTWYGYYASVKPPGTTFSINLFSNSKRGSGHTAEFTTVATGAHRHGSISISRTGHL
jgi:hypothetical protein